MKKIIQFAAVLLGLLPLGVHAQCTSRYTGTGTSTTTAGSAAGLYGQYYAGAFHSQTGFSEGSPVTFFSGAASGAQRVDAVVNFTDAGFNGPGSISPPATGGTGTPTNFSARYRGSVTLKAGSAYTFYLTSDDASYMFLGQEATQASPTPNKAFIKNGGDHGNIEVSNTVSTTSTGLYDIQVLLGQGGGGVTVRLEYAGGPDNLPRQVVPQSAMCAGPSGQSYSSNVLTAGNQADLATTLVGSASLNGASITTAPQGSLVYYTATTTNNGPITANNVTTTINLPAGLTGISLSNSGVYNSATGVATFPAYSLASGAVVSFNIAFSMPGSTVNGTGTAISATQTDLNNNNDRGTTFTSPTQVADVSVAVNGPTRVLTNQAVVYSVVPTNIGPSTATGVTLRAQLATGLAGVVASGPGAPGSGSYNAVTGVVTWPLINSLANGASLVYTVRFNSPTTAGGTITAAGSATSTTANGDPVTSNNDGSLPQSNITTQVVNTAATLLCVTPGADGNASPLAAGFNTYFPGVGTVNAGATTITLGAASVSGATPIRVGDLLLIMQMQGGNIDATNTDAYGDGVNGDNLAAGVKLDASFTAGVYEYAIATNAVPTTGGSLTISQGLGFGFVSAVATATAGQRTFQVIRVPRYNNVTLNADITAQAWNGSTGGVLALDVNGTLDLAGHKLDMVGRGFRGGAGQQLGGAGGVASTDYRNSAALNTSANKGEGIIGTPRYVNSNGTLLDTRTTGLPSTLNDGYPNGDRGRGAPGNAGGGGTDGDPGSNSQNTGGGGGANAGRGGVGGNGWSSNSATGGYGGAGFTQATASRIIMGGGGGAGTTNNGTVADPATYPANTGIPTNGFSSSGAAGGGIVIIRAAAVSANAGTIDVSGNSMNYVPENDGSGGAGAGGSVVLLCNASNGNANSTVLNNITILANGGVGGSNTGGGSPHGPGGGGAGGVSFTSSPTNSASSLTPGANGTTFGFSTYGSGVGSASLGQGLSSITRADLPNVVVGCPADVVTTITSSVAPSNTASPGTTVTFTTSSVNNGPGTAKNVQETITLAPAIANVQPNGQTSPTSTDAFSGVQTFADGSTYNPATGVVTFPVVATLNSGATLANGSGQPNKVSFVMPTQNVLGTAASRSDADADPRLANNDGSLPAANTKVTAINSIAGTIFDDINYGGGSGRNLAAANSSAVASGFPTGAIGSAGTRVELYNSSNTFVAATTTGADGTYGFAGIAVGNYTVRVVNSTVQSARNRTATGLVPVQTFRTNASTGTVVADANRVGGESPGSVDGPANFSSVTLSLVGLNLSGGDNTAFLDQIEILDASNNVVAGALGNASFETPSVGGGFQYSPSGATWTFNGNSGIAGNGSGFANPNAPAGVQVGLLQGTSSIVQALSVSPGTYHIRLKAAQRNQTGQPNDQTISVRINGSEIGRIQPPNDGTYAPAGTYSLGYTNGAPGTSGSLTFTAGSVSTGIVAQSIAPINLSASGVTGVDFGFNFDVVVNKNDAGQGSLRQFLLNSNALPNGNLDQAASSNGGPDPAAGVETSIFMIPDGAAHSGLTAYNASTNAGLISQLNGSGVAVITPNTATNGALPAITDPNTVLDATTQTLNVGNTNNTPLGTTTAVGTAATALTQVNGPEVQISGTPGQNGSDYGLTIAAANVTVKGLSILGFGNTGASTTGNLNGANLYVTGNATTGTLITGNVIGTGATAYPTNNTDPNSATTRSPGNGILLAGLTSGTTVSATISNNLIGYNGASGIEDLANGTTNSVSITGNDIRSNARLNTTADGVHLGLAGGTVQNNLIIDNRGSGVDLFGSAGAALITGNTIRNSGAGNTETSGVRAYGQGSTISLNVISGNVGSGVLALPGTNAANVSSTTFITRNSITGNAKLGIDLMRSGDSETAGAVTLNDMGDNDGGKNSSSLIGGNGLINFPVITQARINGGNLLVRGYARPGATVELFGVTLNSNTANASGFGEGGTYLASAVEGSGADSNNQVSTYSGTINGLNQGTDYTNVFVFTIPLISLPSTVAIGSVLSATATLAGIGTSEFSGNVTVAGGPLPVELVLFTAEAVQNRDAALRWTTASEKNSDHFEVERSLNGRDYAAIGQVQGQGSKATATDYALTDAGVGSQASGVVYYRLRQVDTDGTATYSPVRAVRFVVSSAGASAAALGLWPNPAGSATTVDLSQLPAGTYEVQVLDATGRRVLGAVGQGGVLQGLDLGSLASGTYLVRVQGAGLTLTKRLLKE